VKANNACEGKQCKTFKLNYPDTYKEIRFTGCLYLWWPLLLCRVITMGFTLLCTRLAFNHLGPLSCQRLGLSATLTTWISTLYVRQTNSLEFQDATLLKSLSNYIHYNTTMKSHQEIYGITSNSCHIHVLTPYSTYYLMTSKSHVIAPPTNQFINHFISYQLSQYHMKHT